MNKAFSKIWIIIVLIILITGGIFAYKYWWMPKEEAKSPEEYTKITITPPAKGEKWLAGETYQIRWTSANPNEIVEIRLNDTSAPSAALVNVWAKANIPNTGEYSFTVPDFIPFAGNVYQINILNMTHGYVNAPEGYSELFSIISEDETASWKTYRNEEYGFEIKYPKDWYIYANNPSDVFIQLTKEELGSSIPGPHPDAFEIEVKSITLNTTLLQAIQWRLDEIKKAGISFTQENIKIGRKDGLKIITICEGVGCGAPEWFVVNGNYLYHLDSNLGYSNIFDEILSTFKFIEPKGYIYTLEEGNFTIRKSYSTGYVLKKENGEWKEIISYQDTPSCALLLRHNVPPVLYKEFGFPNGTCWDNGEYDYEEFYQANKK